MKTLVRRSIFVLLVVPLVTVYVMSFTVRTGRAQAPEPVREGTCELAQDLFPDTNPGPGNLAEIEVPEPTDLERYVRNRDVATALGKALFWDMQVGSDGVQACASCHFRAGADPRAINQLNPGGADNPDPTLHLGVNHQLRASDFPLHAGRSDRPPLASAARRRRCRLVARCALVAVRERGTRGDQGRHRARGRPGVQHRRHQHSAVRAAQYTDDDQRRVQPQ